MGSITRYHVIGAVAVVICLWGLVRAARILFTPSGGGIDATFDLTSTPDFVPAPPSEVAFPQIRTEAGRNPFEAHSPWREPQRDELPPPPLGELVRLRLAPLLLRPDGVPSIGGIPDRPEKSADLKLLARIRRIFKAPDKGAASPEKGAGTAEKAPEAPAGQEGAAGPPAKGAESPPAGGGSPAKGTPARGEAGKGGGS